MFQLSSSRQGSPGLGDFPFNQDLHTSTTSFTFKEDVIIFISVPLFFLPISVPFPVGRDLKYSSHFSGGIGVCTKQNYTATLREK